MFKGKLYDFQEVGAQKLKENDWFLLADEMGTGKSAQAIHAVEKLNLTKVLILCPKTICHQWKNEIEKFTDSTAVVIDGSKKKREELYNSDAKYFIVNYEKVLSDFSILSETTWGAIIADEVQRIKNWKSKTSQLTKRIPAYRKWALTGTPIENTPDELYSIFSFLKPFFLGTWFDFEFRYIEKDLVVLPSGKTFWMTRNYKHLDDLKAKIRDKFLRRRKDEVAKDLPPVSEENIYCILKPEQKRIYNDLKKKAIEAIQNQESHLGHLVLLRVTACNSYGIALSNSILAQGYNPIKGESGKMEELHNLLEDIFKDKTNNIIIFTQWKKMQKIIKDSIEEPCSIICGGQTMDERREEIQNFGKQNRILISTDAGAYGINLQQANYIIHFDHPWNPAKLSQRTARAHRIGQKRPVTVFNLFTEGTIEERVVEVLNQKKEYFDAIIENKKEDTAFNKKLLLKILKS